MKLNINGQTIEVTDEDLSKALEEKKESFEIKSDDIVLRTKTDHDTFIENVKKESIGVSSEIARKELLKSVGIDIEGTGVHKSDEKATEAINLWAKGLSDKAVTDAGVEPDKKVTELTEDMAKLRGNILTITNERDDALGKNKAIIQGHEKDTLYRGLIPDNAILPEKDMLMIMNNGIKTSVDENGVRFGIGEDGNSIKDSNRNLMPIKEVVSSFFNDNPQYLKTAGGGAGGDDSSGGEGKQSLEDFTKEMNEAGNDTNGSEFIKQMGERQKAGTLAA